MKNKQKPLLKKYTNVWQGDLWLSYEEESLKLLWNQESDQLGTRFPRPTVHASEGPNEILHGLNNYNDTNL
jgi:hypothetical protein